MYVNQINRNNNTNFTALKKISCTGAGTFNKCSYNENLIANELKKIASKDVFFQNYDVKAYIDGYKGKMSLKLSYKPASNSFAEKLKSLFKPNKVIKLVEKRNCTIDATFYLAKQLREISSFTKYI